MYPKPFKPSKTVWDAEAKPLDAIVLSPYEITRELNEMARQTELKRKRDSAEEDLEAEEMSSKKARFDPIQ